MLQENARDKNLRGFLGKDAEGILGRLEEWGEKKIARSLPLNVIEVPIFPEKMPLDTLQFSERLGYRKENAIEMITMGCYNTLWALRKHLEQNAANLDTLEKQVLDLARQWMEVNRWPSSDEDEQLKQLYCTWKCKREQCLYHADRCPHGIKN